MSRTGELAGRAIPGVANRVVLVGIEPGRDRAVVGMLEDGQVEAIGSQVEEDERPCDAVHRTWADRTGLPMVFWEPFMRRRGRGYAVHYYRALLPRHLDLPEDGVARRESPEEDRWVVLDLDVAAIVDTPQDDLVAVLCLARTLPADAWVEMSAG